MPELSRTRARWRPREPVSGLTHLAGAVLGLAGLILLVTLAWGDPWRVASFAVYGGALVLLYSASTLYHSLNVTERALRRLKRLDHIAIFVLIAGTYTPVALVTLRAEHPAWGWAVLGAVWAFALAGAAFKLLWLSAPRWLYTGLYLLMGWLALAAIYPLSRALPPGGLAWLALGGLFYTVGAVIYALKRPNLSRHVGFHELWHLFVLAGSLAHFLMMRFYVLPG